MLMTKGRMKRRILDHCKICWARIGCVSQRELDPGTDTIMGAPALIQLWGGGGGGPSQHSYVCGEVV